MVKKIDFLKIKKSSLFFKLKLYNSFNIIIYSSNCSLYKNIKWLKSSRTVLFVLYFDVHILMWKIS